MTDQAHALIADDEPHLLDYMESQLASAWPGLRITRAANGIQALQLIDELAPDVVFLDIQMPGLNGIDLAARLCEGAHPPRVVFTTAYDHYTLQAFEHAAFDYLLKPIGLERLSRTVSRLKETLAKPATSPPADALAALLRQLGVAAAAPAPLQWIRAAKGQETRLISIDEVIYFQSNDKYTSVFLAEGESLIRTPLSKLKEQLDAQQFWQIHRGVIVAAKHIAGTRTDFRGRLHVRLKGRDEQLVVSRNYVDLFKQM
ncbi:LytTR family DNA-binding domain-containing protein [Massilia sp. G4R7]|uniref:LytTR family DNA-binding domain-containing protein n=1 Tax=Massilia phyllostachyos TaxID=2898585 RepID=A0ABS8Q152_9BURK|nr:LytTR family DNA-binding domain-containing protein [Massilia phyllostachyos]MCD2515479.1 LytTR family DNA-binding domain-containing protein [Massilia phyllostachyos]